MIVEEEMDLDISVKRTHMCENVNKNREPPKLLDRFVNLLRADRTCRVCVKA